MTVKLLLLQIIMLLSQAYGVMCLGKIEVFLPLITLIIGNIIWALLIFYGMIQNYMERKRWN